MKTSNKILLGIFLTIIVLSATINLMVYAKYKRGDYVPFVRDESAELTTVNLPASKYISISGLCDVELVNSNTGRFEVKKGEEKGIVYQVVGDTIVIRSSTPFTNDQMDRGECNHQMVKLHFPAATEVLANYTHVRIKRAKDSAQAPSYNIHLNKQSLLLMYNDDDSKFINQLTLSSDNSSINLKEHLVVYNLNLKLNSSHFDSKKARIRGLTLDVDDNTTINLSGFSIQ